MADKTPTRKAAVRKDDDEEVVVLKPALKLMENARPPMGEKPDKEE
jgi:hypothetical protein